MEGVVEEKTNYGRLGRISLISQFNSQIKDLKKTVKTKERNGVIIYVILKNKEKWKKKKNGYDNKKKNKQNPMASINWLSKATWDNWSVVLIQRFTLGMLCFLRMNLKVTWQKRKKPLLLLWTKFIFANSWNLI